MKKIIIFCLISVTIILVIFASCGDEPEEISEQQPQQSSSEAEEVKEQVAETKPAETKPEAESKPEPEVGYLEREISIYWDPIVKIDGWGYESISYDDELTLWKKPPGTPSNRGRPISHYLDFEIVEGGISKSDDLVDVIKGDFNDSPLIRVNHYSTHSTEFDKADALLALIRKNLHPIFFQGPNYYGMIDIHYSFMGDKLYKVSLDFRALPPVRGFDCVDGGKYGDLDGKADTLDTYTEEGGGLDTIELFRNKDYASYKEKFDEADKMMGPLILAGYELMNGSEKIYASNFVGKNSVVVVLPSKE